MEISGLSCRKYKLFDSKREGMLKMERMNSRRIGVVLGILFLVGLTASTVYSRGFAERQKPFVSVVASESRVLSWEIELAGVAERASEEFQDRAEWMTRVKVLREDYEQYMSEFITARNWPAEVIIDGAGWRWPAIVIQRENTEEGVYITIGYNTIGLPPSEGEGARVFLGFEMDNMPTMLPEAALHYDIFTNSYYVYVVVRRDGFWGREFVAQRENVIIGLPYRVGDLMNVFSTSGMIEGRPVVVSSDRPLYDGALVRLFD